MDSETLKRYMDLLYNRCYRILGDESRAFDALQDIMVQFYEKVDPAQLEQPLRYLYKMSTNHCLMQLRKRKSGVSFATEVREEMWGTARNLAEARLTLQQLEEYLDPEELQLLMFRYVDQMTFEQIGQWQGISDRGAKKRLEKLEDKIKAHFGGHWDAT